jgi:hypothetical protein
VRVETGSVVGVGSYDDTPGIVGESSNAPDRKDTSAAEVEGVVEVVALFEMTMMTVLVVVEVEQQLTKVSMMRNPFLMLSLMDCYCRGQYVPVLCEMMVVVVYLDQTCTCTESRVLAACQTLSVHTDYYNTTVKKKHTRQTKQLQKLLWQLSTSLVGCVCLFDDGVG